MEVALNHAEVDQRADELARLVLLRDKVATINSGIRAKLKAAHEEELAKLDARIEKLASAVRNQREDTDAQLSMKFEVVTTAEPGVDPTDDLADRVAAAEAEGEDPEPPKPRRSRGKPSAVEA